MPIARFLLTQGNDVKIQKIKTPATGAVKTDKVRKNCPAEGATKATSDRVEITSMSTQVQALEKSLASVEVFDSKRVDQVKQEISEGRFRVNPEVVADKLVAAVKDLVLSRKE